MKGFLFSIDTMISLGLILIAATTLWVTVNETANTDLIAPKLQNLEINMLYFNEPAIDINPANKNEKCEELYYYDSSTTKNPIPTQTMNQKTICEGN